MTIDSIHALAVPMNSVANFSWKGSFNAAHFQQWHWAAIWHLS